MKVLKKWLNRIFIDGLTGMAQGLFATLIVGTIIQQVGSLIGGNVGDSLVLPKNQTIFLGENVILWTLMTLQDAIDFVRYAINTTIDTMRFTNVNKTVGGPIDILVITPNKAKWISHKKLH